MFRNNLFNTCYIGWSLKCEWCNNLYNTYYDITLSTFTNQYASPLNTYYINHKNINGNEAVHMSLYADFHLRLQENYNRSSSNYKHFPFYYRLCARTRKVLQMDYRIWCMCLGKSDLSIHIITKRVP